MTDLISDLPGPDGPFFAGLLAGEIRLPRCAQCGLWHWPAVFRCGECGSWQIDWLPVAGQGRLFSHARSWHRFAGSEGLELPYVSVLVELPQAGGRRLLGVLEGDDTGLKIGAAMQARISSVRFGEQEVPALRWRLKTEASA